MSHIAASRKHIFAAVAAVCALAAAAAIVMPWMETMYDPELRAQFIAYADSLGIFGYILMFGIQLVQVVVAIIPGEPAELMAGALCGGLGGLALCLAGSALASAAIFTVMRRFGQKLLARLFPKKKLDEFGFLADSRRLDTVTLILFLIPGTPKDMLTYVAGTTRMPMARFLIISTFARIPSVVSSTFIGANMLSGNLRAAVILLLVTFAIGLAGIFIREPVIDFCRRRSPASRSKER